MTTQRQTNKCTATFLIVKNIVQSFKQKHAYLSAEFHVHWFVEKRHTKTADEHYQGQQC